VYWAAFGEYRVTFYVKYPPSDGLPPPDRRERDLFTTGETPAHQDAIRAIEACESRFGESGNPIEAINAFMYAHGAELYPPPWALEFINARFLKASKGGGLDLSFGFTRKGKGNPTTPKERQRLSRRNYAWCLGSFKLQALGLTASAAGKAVAALWQQETGETFSGGAVTSAVAGTKQQYESERKVIFIAASFTWTKEEKRALLRGFGPVNLPRDIRKAYGI
jgi:hypothetical protein